MSFLSALRLGSKNNLSLSAKLSDPEEALLPKEKLSEERPLKGFAEMGDEQKSLRLPSLGQSAQKPKAPVLRTTIIIAIWFASNIGILLLNKHLLGGYGFRFPVLLTLCHMIACVVLSQATDAMGLVRHQALQSRQQLAKVSVLASAFLLSVVLGNVALRYIPVSFSQAIGATTPAATAVMALALLGTVEKAVTYISLIPVMAGIVLATGFEPSFNSFGFLAALGACCARAFKAVLQGILLADQSEKLDSMNLLRLMSPIAVAMLLPAVALLEPTGPIVAWRLLLAQPRLAALLISNASLAYIVNFANFQITHYTSALTLQVLGCAKGVLATVVSVLIFQNPITIPGCAGYAMTVVGVFAYGLTKMKGPGR